MNARRIDYVPALEDLGGTEAPNGDVIGPDGEIITTKEEIERTRREFLEKQTPNARRVLEQSRQTGEENAADDIERELALGQMRWAMVEEAEQKATQESTTRQRRDVFIQALGVD